MQDKEARIKELIRLLNEASRAYYSRDNEIMDNFTYDKLYKELEDLEDETNIHFSDSPTENVGYQVVDYLPKFQHPSPMLSLDKTKDVEELKAFIGDNKSIISWKMDGLTIVLTYQGGELLRAVTRGNGYQGEIITGNAKAFKNLPVKIPFKGQLVIRGEAYISYSDFERINNEIEDVEAKYKNPRNLCSGSVRQLDAGITAKRNVRLKVFSLVEAENMDFNNSHEEEFKWLESMGFDVVERKTVTGRDVEKAVQWFSREIENNDFPSDGLVALYDDIQYGKSLGVTAKFPRNAYAFKWKDEIKTTHLRRVEWSPSRTGLLNPVAIFDTVELEGTAVSRASLHNVSVVEDLRLGLGDEITVYKANMIIPQIAENLTKSDNLEIPGVCPVCEGKTEIHNEMGSKTLHCTNPNCPAKKIKSFTLFVSRDALNIEGLSEATLEKFIGAGLIHNYRDILTLGEKRQEILQMEGFKERSVDNLAGAIEKAKTTTLLRIIYGLGIPGVGLEVARLIVNHYNSDVGEVEKATLGELTSIEGIGDVIAASFANWFSKDDNIRDFHGIIELVNLEKPRESGELLKGVRVVITGSLKHFSSRALLKERIQSLGGKVMSSVSGETTYLINNDILSASTKNRTAKKLGVEIISEEDFLGKYHIEGEENAH